jgi:hypothetical protein
MNRRQLEHVIRAAAELTGETEIVVVGFQAILAVGTEVPADMLRSQEADLYPLHNPKLADLVEGAIGAGSIFEDGIIELTHETQGLVRAQHSRFHERSFVADLYLCGACRSGSSLRPALHSPRA